MSLTASSSSLTLAKSQVVQNGIRTTQTVTQLNALFASGGSVPVRNQTNPQERVPNQVLTPDDVADAFGPDSVKLKAACAAFVAALQ